MVATESVTLSQRIRAEFDARERRHKESELRHAQESEDHERRMEQFNATCEDLKNVWTPRLQEFTRQFGERVRIKPEITPSRRAAVVRFITELANMTLTITVTPDADATKMVLDYDLLIIPMYFEYQRHSRLEVPLDQVDAEAVGKWLDDRLVSCVQAYLAIQDNELYLRRAIAEDPITRAKFLKDDAAAKLDHAGHTVYFATKQSFEEFKQKHQIKG